nr:iron chelate uptake ABC transporter family permease subunit [Planococcus sp. ISL-109]
MKKRILIPILIVLSLVSLFVGVSSISPADLLDFTSEETQIFLVSRFPRLIAILLAGLA